MNWIDIYATYESFTGFRISDIFKAHWNCFIVLNGNECAALSAHKELHCFIAQISCVVDIVSDRSRATEFITDFFIDDWHFNINTRQFCENFLFQNFAEVQFSVANVPVFVEYDVSEFSKIFFSNFFDNAFSNNCDAVTFADDVTFDDWAYDNINNLLEANFRLRKFFRNNRNSRACTAPHTECEVSCSSAHCYCKVPTIIWSAGVFH